MARTKEFHLARRKVVEPLVRENVKFLFDFHGFCRYNNNMAEVERFEWDENKRQKIIQECGLDISVLAPLVLAAPNTVFLPDNRRDYGEERWLAFGIVSGLRLCVCFTLRNDVVRLITIYKVNKRDWEKYYGNEN